MDLIGQLADIVGFHPSYTGTFGDKVFATDEAKQALLEAMGFELDEQSLIESIAYLNQRRWTTILPVVYIAKLEEQQHAITVSLPNIEGLVLHWQITVEETNEVINSCSDKSLLTGTVKVSDLAIIAEKTIGEIRYCQYLLNLPTLFQGYHQLTVKYSQDDVNASHSFEEQSARCPLIYAPKTCYSAQDASANKMWGYTAQLYSLRSNDNWGMGDFGDLSKLVDISAQQQAATIGLNPLHPLYVNNPSHRSPYSPSTRCFINPIYIDVTQIANFEHCQLAQQQYNSTAFQHSLAEAKGATLVDYPKVAKLKYQIVELLFADFCLNVTDCWEKSVNKADTYAEKISHAKNSVHLAKSTDEQNLYRCMAENFEAFKAEQGNDLQQFATFDALYEHFQVNNDNSFGWQDWPLDFQNPLSEAVREFQLTHATRIDYFCFLQWIAAQQLSAIKKQTGEQNMAIGLYLDLAVGCDGSGFDVWSDQAVYVAGASIGAPPDDMNALGQNWGLTPINPVALQEQGYQPLVKALRSSMQYAGALRIDHILGLMRQYWVAPGMGADEGVYISFPWDDILRIIALESRRNNCVVIGEDLGNVPDGFSETIQNAGLLSFKVLFFERWDSGLFKRPDNFPEQSIVTIATHDTATLTGWWQGRDLEWREQLDLYPNETAGQADRDSRVGERKNLIAALNDLHVIDMNKAPQLIPAVMNTELSMAVQKYLAMSPSHLQLIPIEDMLEIAEQVNIPGTIDEHPNWLQKLPVLLEDFWQTDSMTDIVNAINAIRPK
ncbi:4-alpha-glucanotransferase [Colwellia echini]|uniref:4-alpha-glucanotransferase n=1 Tax=Colwellia echini TaxID=1982103 RepID=A0ABY3MY28_9GAMM|nr:4-alpha-glucanotransferase [Colwellia echini]TYK66118.1 4-alpha-glucanotransferase [Colwellia echini]